MIYTGTMWESLCTTNISSFTSEDYFVVRSGIPYIPVNNNYPTGTPEGGAIYYSTINSSLMIYDGTGWTKLTRIENSSFSESPGFSTGVGVRTCKLPLLNADPSPSGLAAGAFYINTTLKAFRFYNGTTWQNISCGPVLNTLAPTDIKINTATGGGNVINTGGSAITALGVCWSLSANPDITLATKTIQAPSGDGSGSFTCELTGLLPNTTYHVRAYAISPTGTSYGEDRTFTTDYSPPTIITAEATDIQSTTAVSGGDITFDGGAAITARGIIWSTDPDPQHDPGSVITHDGSGVGPFPSTLTGLTELTTYYIQAYATNGRGTSYGNIVQFTSPPATPPLLSSSDIHISNITDISALGQGFILNNGGSPVTEQGICWSTDRINIQFGASGSNIDIGSFTADLTGLTSGTTYYVRAYAKNKAGIAYSTETSFITASYVTLTTAAPSGITGTGAVSGGMISNTGQAQITSKGVCWNTSPEPDITLSTKTVQNVTDDGIGPFTSNITGLTPGKKYYVRAYAINTHGIAYGDEYSFTTLDLPGITTLPPAALVDNSAVCGGDIFNDGGSQITYRGVCWSTEDNPDVTGAHTSNGTGSGVFSTKITGLEPNTLYHVRAYATNATGTAYGADLTFTIATELPAVNTTAVSDITNISGISGGNITNNGGASITGRGVRVSTLPYPAGDLNATVISKGTGEGEFTAAISGLLGNTTYYIQAFAVNSYGTGYGEVRTFKTLPATAPVLSSDPLIIYGINNNTALSTVTILNNGGALVTERGIRWSTDGLVFRYEPAINTGGSDIGTFICNMKALSAGTTYYAQTYATNSVGTTYSEQATFTTTAYTALATLTTTAASNITGTTAVAGGHISDNGDALISSRGVIWSTSEEDLTIDLTNKTIEPVDGDGIGSFSANINGLSPGTIYYVVAYAVNAHGTAYGNVTSMITPGYPAVTTTAISSLTGGSVISGGNVTFDGGAFITARGVCWSTVPSPVISDNHTADGTGSGTFSSFIAGLTGSTKYYVRAYATNSAGTVYGNEISFNTAPAGLPLITTNEVSNIGGTSVTGGGKITSDGGAPVSTRGVCWSTNPDPQISGSHAESGGGTGDFSVTLTGLLPGTKYYLRAYAVNSVGMVYGNEVIFTTFTTPTIITAAVTSVTNISASGGGSIISDGGTRVISSGICWNITGSPDLSGDHTTSGTGTGSFIHQLTSLLGSTKYYVRAYATNNAGTSYGNEEVFTTAAPGVPVLTTTPAKSGVNGTTGLSGGLISSNGGSLITAAGVYWGIKAGFDPATESVGKTIQSASSDFSSTLTGLVPGTTYYVRAYANNGAGTGYAANEVSFITYTTPAVITSVPAVATITRNSAVCGGGITSDGGTTVTASGICWSNTTSKPTLNDEHTSTGTPGTGAFLQTITGLLGSTSYNIRAYATNSAGTSYGNVETITTLPPVPATLTTRAPVSTSASEALTGGNITDDGGGMVTTRGVYWSTAANFNPEDPGISKTAQTGYYKGNFEATMTGLAPGVVYYVKAYVINNAGVSYGNEVSFIMPSLPVISTVTVSAIKSNTAVSGGTISSNGGASVTARGVLWSTVPNFVPDMISDNKTSDSYGSGTFSSAITGLRGNTTYYVRAYATNVVGTQFGNQLSFITDPSGLAALVTSDVSSITGSSAVGGGYISNDGGAPVGTRGVIWSTVKDFDPETETTNRTAQTGAGTGSFTSSLNGLTEGTTYYIRAYAVNSSGTSYGNQLSFATLTVPSLTTIPPVAASSATVASSGGIINSNGGAGITNQGVCWNTSPNPTTGLYTKTSYDGGTATGFSSKMTGLTPATAYYVRAYAVNSLGTAYGNELTFITPAALATLTTSIITVTSESTASCGGEITDDGGSAVTARGVRWSTDQNFNPDTVTKNQTIDGDGTGSFTSIVTGLQNSIKYYVRAYAVTSAGTAYGNQVEVVIFPTSPVLTTTEVSAISGSAAKSGGNVIRDGGAAVTVRGIVWDTSHNPITALSTKTTENIGSGSGTGSFTGTMSGLQPNTQYYVRAYAVNRIGTAYGLEIPFLTAALPTLTATDSVTSIAATTAVSGGLITDDGRSPVTVRGICWSTTSNPTTANAKTIDVTSSGIGTISGTMTGLIPNTLYYVRAYASNAVGTAYGSEVSFTTAVVLLPTLTTTPASSVSSSSVNSGGMITSDGGTPVTGRGICWTINSTQAPIILLPTTVYNSTGGIGSFTNAVTGLSPATTYYIRAFATNTLGTAYGNLETFTTLPAVPAVSMVTISNVTMLGAEASATVTDNGGAELTDRGLYWNTTGIPPVATDTSISNGSIGTAINGILKDLTQSTKYYVWAYASNSVGTGFSKPAVFTTLSLTSLTTTKPTLITRTTARSGGNIISTGGATITDRGVCWNTKAPPAIANIKVSSGPGSTGSFITDLSGLMEGTKYYVRAYAISNLGVDYGNLDSLTTLTTATVITSPVSLITSTAAGSGGNITSDGGVTVTARGICWSTTIPPVIDQPGTFKTTNGTGTGSFTSQMTGLAPVTTYYVRAYATSAQGTSYGNLEVFTTLPVPPVVSNLMVETLTGTSASGSATVISDGGAEVTSRGICWNTTGNPVTTDHIFEAGAGTGDFTGELTGLLEGYTYYARAYATNSGGTGYSPLVTTFKICPSFTVIHTEGLNGAPETKTITYGSVGTNISGSIACWITQNLGASREALSPGDDTEASTGWYWQFNRAQGYKATTSGYIPSNAWTAWTASIYESANWAPAADPCALLLSAGWRMPTSAEWTSADGSPQNWSSVADTYSSVLKLHPAGYMAYDTGLLTNSGSTGYYWSSTQSGYTNGYALNLGSSSSVVAPNKAQASAVRCIRDVVTPARPSVSNVKVPASSMTTTSVQGIATVTPDGGAPVTARGLCWNTTGTPTIEDNPIACGSGTGIFASDITGLKDGITYYVRAYATNSLGTVYSPQVTSFKLCPAEFTVIHIAGLNGAPETKTVTYHSVSTNISGSAACWLTQNLGAVQQPVSDGDAAEASAGWYWQFNRAQGYKPVGTGYIPSNAWTAWITSIYENASWAAANDPCVLLLSAGWRLPVYSEWNNADAQPQYWTIAADAYNSVLKLNMGGYLAAGTGTLTTPGTTGYYWSSSSNGYSVAYALSTGTISSSMASPDKANAFPLRCIRDAVVPAKPAVSKVIIPTTTMTATTASGTATVTPDGGAPVTARGLCWNTTGTPTIADNPMPAGTGTGQFSLNLTGLAEGTTYYVRAYATNSAGTVYSPEVTSFKLCSPEFTVIHTAGLNGAPVTKTVTYHSVSTNISGAAACWLTQNLGAEQEAVSANDNTEASAGWYWQFNRPQGYEYNDVRKPSNAWTAWTSSIYESANWAVAADPCVLLLSGGWRLPTSSEWSAADAQPQYWNSATDTYASVLKLHPAGFIAYDTGLLTNRGTTGYYWSNTQSGYTNAYALNLGSGSSVTAPNKAQASAIRCIRDAVIPAKPSVSNVTVPTSSMTASTAEGTATVTPDGGAQVTGRGLCWNATGNPVIEDNMLSAGKGTGSFTSVLTGLKEGVTYYVRAYATNSGGTVYSPDITTFKLCPPSFTVIHTEGLNGAPENKTVTYHSVSSNISGAAACWLTQNLGAGQEPLSASDTSQASAGWYWQFNRAQGYKPVGTGYIPSNAWTAWITSIYENANWAATSDPCTLLLSSGWRIPTYSEWLNADAQPQYWTTPADAYSSVLKLHMAGVLSATDGSLGSMGTSGGYWSSSANGYTQAYILDLNGGSAISAPLKTNGFPLRCIRDAVVAVRPSVSNVKVPASTMTATTAKGTATVTPDGGAPVTARGLCWNTTGSPTIVNNVVSGGTGTGEFTLSLIGLTEGQTYYVRAYATNSVGTVYSPDVTSFKICSPAFTVIHTAGLNGAPVTKTVTYHSVSTNISGAAACWLTQNLGADREAVSVNDNTETSAGWYWQFNRPQGYKYSGTIRTPSNAWTAWISSIYESANWAAGADPCVLLLSGGWRLPTSSEWTAADDKPQYWSSAADAYASVLKLHPAGFLAYDTGLLTNRGTTGYYWSNTQSGYTNAYTLNLGSGSSVTAPNKAQASAIRCIRDAVIPAKPSVSNVTVPTSSMTASTAEGTATVTPDGGAQVTGRGLCWNATGNPAIEDNPTPNGNGTGSFTSSMTGLKEGVTYYVRAYATNSAGTVYSPDITTFKLCPPSFTVIHTEGLNGAPENKTVTYHSVSSNISGAAACWLTQNLGADHEATSANDGSAESAGWYWQFNRLQGYKSAGTSYAPSNAWTAWISSINESANWTAATDPCSQMLSNGWRIPTTAEWTAADAAPQYWSTAIDTYGSVLKLHPAGFMAYDSGELTNRGSSGNYWSNAQNATTTAFVLNIGSGSSVIAQNKAFGYSVRCIRDAFTVVKPSVSKVTIPTASMTATTAQGTAVVTPDGGAPVTARGLCWNTTGNPIIEDNPVAAGSGTGSFTATLTGLKEGPVYYVRAYATNSAGTVYSTEVTSFRICPASFTVIHTAGLNGAPVTKTVTYHSVSSNISNVAACWLTQNLGADRQAVSVNDNGEESAGWYWQFNRPQGYKNDGDNRTPNNPWTAWTSSISESANWAAASDPCTLLLSSGWRLPTSTEWSNADAAPQYWTTAADTYASVLKLHPAGYMSYDRGSLTNRGTTGYYWSSMQYNAANGYALNLGSGSSLVYSNKAIAMTLRCIRDVVTVSKPSVSNISIPLSGITATTALGTATITPGGGAAVTDRGLCWNTTGSPIIEDNPVSAGSGTGSFTASLSGLKEGPTYYVRAYAVNSAGINYSTDVTSFKICPSSFSVTHTAGTAGAPESKTVTYHSVTSAISGAAKCWLTQNLGADQKASSPADALESAAGWYWQFNRSQGYKHDGTTRTPATPAWIASISESAQWAPAADPCTLLLSSGWRIPTNAEWTAADAQPQYWTSINDAFGSELKLHAAGFLNNTNGTLNGRGTYGRYWSSTQYNAALGYYLELYNGSSTLTLDKSFGFSLRCIRD